ncbi:head maturation protease, ClpP-related [Streptomyces sp. NRRL F-5123]|uniref:head maturation protease, ClpP-related n=1 Tax=Streptomyces sp. NRRL F-5123 TaxID=1463856 RepID=UPI00069448A4|nr:head maturation protease, ClpP-related [Streptomyces sp. NRRL F-5123]
MPWIEVPDFQPRRPAQAKAQETRAWYSIKNAASEDEAEILLYDEIGGWLGVTADEFVAELGAITAPKIKVRISSPGGSVFDGIAIANALRSHPAQTTVQIDSLAASIASVIAMAGDRVVAAPNATLMVHDASGMCLGDAAEMQKMAEVLDLISNNIADVYAAKAGGTRDEWRAVMRNETWYLPEDALKAGLVDEVMSAKQAPAEDEPAQMRARFDPAAYGYRGPAEPERPKPGPPPARPEPAAEAPAPALVISVADALTETEVAALRELAQAHLDTAPLDPPATTDLDELADEQPDDWAASLAHLTTPAPWGQALEHLTQTPASSATDA